MRHISPIWAGVLVLPAIVLMTGFCPGQYGGYIEVEYNYNQPGVVYANTPSQILPASYLRLHLTNNTFPMASNETPVLITITLPQGMYLSQTLATGKASTASPLPTAGETVIPLALQPYRVMKAQVRHRQSPASTPGPNAVQLFRYVAGESEIWIRVNESPTLWTYEYSEDTWALTIGLGGGVWPTADDSNWGPSGRYQQQSTLFIADTRQFDWAGHEYKFYPGLSAFDQHTHSYIYTIYSAINPMLLLVENIIDWELPVMSTVGTEITDFVTGDINRDGYDDICSIDGPRGRLYWAWGMPGGVFGDLDWIETTGLRPETVDLSDVTGDGRLDCLVSDDTGLLHIYRYEDLFVPQAKETRTALPVFSLALSGVPADSGIHDMNQDGMSDYLFVDKTANNLIIVFGGSFTNQSTFLTGTTPVAMTIADFNGDEIPDAAVANSGSNTISVYSNDGTGNLNKVELPAGGSLPIDIEAADFDRNGQNDIVFATAGNKMLSVWKAQPSGHFDPAMANTVYFQKTPSALLADNFDGLAGPDVLLGFSDNDKLAFCTINDSGQLVHAYSINTLGDVVVDPDSGATLSENNVLSVGGGTSAGGISSRDGVAGLVQQQFDVVTFPRSQDMSFSVVNLGTTDALLNMELYDDAGTLKSSNTQSVPPNTQFPRYFADLLGPEAANPQRWVRSFVTNPDTYGLWLISNGSDLTYLDGLRTPSIRNALFEFILPVIQVGYGFNTQWLLVNPNLDQAHVTIRLRGSDGAVRGTASYLLNGRGRKQLDAPVVFPGVSEGDYLEVEADRPLQGCELFGDGQKFATMEPMVAGVDQGILYSPHVAAGDFGGIVYETILTVINTSDQSATLILMLYNDSGSEIDSYPFFSIGAHSKRVANLGTLMSLPSGTTGYLKINPQGATGIIGTVTFGESGAGRFESCLPLQTPSHNQFILGHLANGTLGDIGFYTGVAVVNPDNTTQIVNLKAYDQYGALLDNQNLTLQARSRRVFLLDQVMPGLTSLFGGYLIVDNKTASAGTLVFELFGDTGFQFLSAVPAVPLN